MRPVPFLCLVPLSVPKQVLLLENVRFHKEEEENDPQFSRKLAESTGADLYVNDGISDTCQTFDVLNVPAGVRI